jgi:hypothetical protein
MKVMQLLSHTGKKRMHEERRFMTEITLRAEEVKARWYEWAEEELGGTPARLQVIASAALNAVAHGLDSVSVMDVARRAAVDYDAQWAAPTVAHEAHTSNSSGGQPFIFNHKLRRTLHFVSLGLLLLVIIGVVWLGSQQSHTQPKVRLPIRQIVKLDGITHFIKSKR